MTRTRRTLQKLARFESMPVEISPSLEQAFAEIERRAPRYADAPPARSPARGTDAGMTQEQRE
jgi:hypothetical protein